MPGGRRRPAGAALAGASLVAAALVAAALAAAAWAATWAAVIAGGHLGLGAGLQITFAASMATVALGETLLSPTPPEAVSHPTRSGAAGRYNRLGHVALTIGLLLGSAVGGAALGAGWRTSLITTLALACAAASIAARRLSRQRRRASRVRALRQARPVRRRGMCPPGAEMSSHCSGTGPRARGIVAVDNPEQGDLP